MGSICRLCLHKNDLDVMKNVFEFWPEYFELNLTEILYWIFDVEIVVEDSYSKLVCFKCLKVIESIGRFRKFFQLNQRFLLERRCPEEYEVQSGWYNTRDISTNTEDLEDTDYVKIPHNELNDLRKRQEPLQNCGKSELQNVEKGDEKTSSKENENSQQHDQATQTDTMQLVNVSIATLEEFLKSKTINKAIERIDIPRSLFNNCSPQVNFPEFNQECSKLGYTKVGNSYCKFNSNTLHIPLRKVESNRMLLRHYNKIGEMTYKTIRKTRKTERVRVQKKMQLIQDYYYRKPTSALRELISETTPLITKQNKVPITSVVTTDEDNALVCRYCSRIFKFKKNHDQHVDRFHKVTTPEKSGNDLQISKIVRRIDSVSARRELNRMTINRLVKYSQIRANNNEVNTTTSSLADRVENRLDNILVLRESTDQENDSNIQTCVKEVVDTQENINMECETVDDNSIGVDQGISKISPESTDSESRYQSWLKVRDIKELQTEEPLNNGTAKVDLSVDYLKAVIFGENSEGNPTITYHVDDHNYATTPTQEGGGKVPFRNRVKICNRKFSKEKLSSDIVNMIEKRFHDIKKTREVLEKIKKLRFALRNEIDNCYIKSFIAATQEKLKVVGST